MGYAKSFSVSPASPARIPISATIITFNEEANIVRAVKSLEFCQEILVVDSGSQDQTVTLAKKHGARVVSNPWRGYGQQKNFAQGLATHEWVLNIDADEEVSPELARELQNSAADSEQNRANIFGFAIPRKTFFLGKWIRHGGWYPNYLVRFAKKSFASWSEPELHESLQVKGKIGYTENPLLHYTFRSLEEQVLANVNYAHAGARELNRSGKSPSLGRLLYKPAGKFFETFLIKRGFMDGLPGFLISANAAYSMFLKYAFLIEDDLHKDSPNAHPDH